MVTSSTSTTRETVNPITATLTTYLEEHGGECHGVRVRIEAEVTHRSDEATHHRQQHRKHNLVGTNIPKKKKKEKKKKGGGKDRVRRTQQNVIKKNEKKER